MWQVGSPLVQGPGWWWASLHLTSPRLTPTPHPTPPYPHAPPPAAKYRGGAGSCCLLWHSPFPPHGATPAHTHTHTSPPPLEPHLPSHTHTSDITFLCLEPQQQYLPFLPPMYVTYLTSCSCRDIPVAYLFLFFYLFFSIVVSSSFPLYPNDLSLHHCAVPLVHSLLPYHLPNLG